MYNINKDSVSGVAKMIKEILIERAKIISPLRQRIRMYSSDIKSFVGPSPFERDKLLEIDKAQVIEALDKIYQPINQIQQTLRIINQNQFLKLKNILKELKNNNQIEYLKISGVEFYRLLKNSDSLYGSLYARENQKHPQLFATYKCYNRTNLSNLREEFVCDERKFNT